MDKHVTPALPSVKTMRQAVLNKDEAYDGIFYVAVRSMHIFCRPSCRAQKPLLKNMNFYATAREAVFAGYRPCRRCRPLLGYGSKPEWLSRLLESIDRDPGKRWRDGDLRRLGIAPETARRYFLKQFGMTFHAYSRGRRLATSFHKIQDGQRLDDIILSHGFDSYSGFRDAFAKAFGVPPGEAANGRAVFLTWMETPIGPMIAGATSEGVCLLEFSDRRMLETQFKTIRRRFKLPLVPGPHRWLSELQTELSEYFKGSRRRFDVPLDYPGTEFERRVWERLLKIPYGETRSYEDLARDLGNPRSQRAVGRANGMNRVAIVIPCHRVINKDGKLGGYGGGLWRKQRLLELETGTLRLI